MVKGILLAIALFFSTMVSDTYAQQVYLNGGIFLGSTLGYNPGLFVEIETNLKASSLFFRQQTEFNAAHKRETGQGWHLNAINTLGYMPKKIGPFVGFTRGHLNGGPWTKDNSDWLVGMQMNTGKNWVRLNYRAEIWNTAPNDRRIFEAEFYQRSKRLQLVYYGELMHFYTGDKIAHWGMAVKIGLGWKALDK